MTDHPLTEAAAVEMWDASPCPEGYEFRGMLTVEQDATVYAMRAAFDAGREHERTKPEDARPWEPLNGPARVGDEVRQDFRGVTHTAVVARVDRSGDPWTAEGAIIGLLCHGTWYVRRAAQELPTEDGAVIIPADGCNRIEAGGTHKFTAETATWDSDDQSWVGLWRDDYGQRCRYIHGLPITPGTWKVADQ